MVNKVILIGNLGKDPEIRNTQGGTAVAKFSLATSERVKGRDGEWTDHTEWHNVVVFGKTAENVGQYCRKGKQVFVEGKIRTQKYQDKASGQDKYFTEIVADTVRFLGGKDGDSREDARREAANYRTGRAGGGGDVNPPPVSDDDIPFVRQCSVWDHQ